MDTSEYTNGLNDASNKTSSFGDKLKSGLATAAKVGAAAIGAATAAATAFASDSVKTGATFDSAMSQISATLGMTTHDIQNNVNGAGDTFDMLREKALQVGRDTNFSATEAAQGLNILVMSGYDAYDSVDMIEDVLHLAAAGAMDMGSAAGFVSGAMKGFNDSTKDSAYYTDLFAKGATLANTSVPQLSEAISDASSVASAYGQTAESLTLTMLRLAEQNVTGTAASTAYAAAVKNLFAPTNQAKKVLQDLGVNAYEPTTGAARDFNDVVNELQVALSGYTDEQKTAYTQTIFGIQGFDAYNKMIVTSVDKQNEWTEALANATGEAARQYDTMTDNLLGDVDKWNSALEGFKIILSDQLTPTVREFVQFGTNAISTLSAAFKDGGLTGAMEALGTILSDGLNMVIAQLPKMVDAGMQLIGALGKGLLDNLPTITDAAVEIVLMLVNGIIEGLPALAEGGVKFIYELAAGIGQALPKLIPTAVEAVLKFIEGLTNPQSINSLIGCAVQLIEGLIEGIIKALPLLIEYAPEIVVNIVTGIISAIPQLIEVGGQLIAGLLQGLVQAIVSIPAAIAKVVTAIIDGFKALFGIHSPSTVMAEMGVNLIDGLLQGISDTWNSIVNFFSGAVQSLIAFFGQAWGTIKSAASVAWEAIKGVFEVAWSGIQSVWSGVVSFFSGIWSGIQSVFLSVEQVLGGFFKAAWDSVQSAWSASKEFFSGVADGIRSIFETVTQFLSDAFKQAWEAVKSAWEAAKQFFSGLWNSIKETASSAASAIGDALKKGWEAVKSAWDGAKSFFSGVWDSIKGVFSGALSHFKSIGADIMNGLINGIKEKVTAVKNAVSNVVSSIKNVFTGKSGFDEHSPSKWAKQVFRYVMDGGVIGMDDGASNLLREVDSIVGKVKNGLDFGTTSVGLSANASYRANRNGNDGQQTGYNNVGGTTVNIYSPVAVDAVQAAREWEKTSQRIAMGLV